MIPAISQSQLSAAGSQMHVLPCGGTVMQCSMLTQLRRILCESTLPIVLLQIARHSSP